MEINLRNTKQTLIEIVDYLCNKIGERSIYKYENILKTQQYIYNEFRKYGYLPEYEKFTYLRKTFNNIIAISNNCEEKDKSIIIGAHYDTVYSTVGADDNASSVAIMLALAKILKEKKIKTKYTIKFIGFCLEEPPVFGTKNMGSFVSAKNFRKNNENIIGMICLEMVGFTGEKQKYPLPAMSLFYPKKADFIGIIGNLNSKNLVKNIEKSFKKIKQLKTETLITFKWFPSIDLSDHSSFWHFNYPAVMITDTAFYRNPNYHTAGDTPDTLNYNFMFLITEGLLQYLIDL